MSRLAFHLWMGVLMVQTSQKLIVLGRRSAGWSAAAWRCVATTTRRGATRLTRRRTSPRSCASSAWRQPDWATANALTPGCPTNC